MSATRSRVCRHVHVCSPPAQFGTNASKSTVASSVCQRTLHCLIRLQGLRDVQMSGAQRSTAVTDSSFFTHTRKQTVRKYTNRVHTQGHRHRHTRPLTDGSHTPTTEFPFTCTCIPCSAQTVCQTAKVKFNASVSQIEGF